MFDLKQDDDESTILQVSDVVQTKILKTIMSELVHTITTKLTYIINTITCEDDTIDVCKAASDRIDFNELAIKVSNKIASNIATRLYRRISVPKTDQDYDTLSSILSNRFTIVVLRNLTDYGIGQDMLFKEFKQKSTKKGWFHKPSSVEVPDIILKRFFREFLRYTYMNISSKTGKHIAKNLVYKIKQYYSFA